MALIFIGESGDGSICLWVPSPQSSRNELLPIDIPIEDEFRALVGQLPPVPRKWIRMII